jgi:hypothetical protein
LEQLSPLFLTIVLTGAAIFLVAIVLLGLARDARSRTR